MFKRKAQQTDLPGVAFHLNDYWAALGARLEPFSSDPNATRSFGDPLAVAFSPFPDYLTLWAREENGVWVYWKGFTMEEEEGGLSDTITAAPDPLPAPQGREVLRAGEKPGVVAASLWMHGLMGMCDAIVADPDADPSNLEYARHLLADDVRRR